MRPFFITGLPRCRTAWLANYFSYGNTVCLHDLRHRLTLTEIIEKLESTKAENIGYADPALVLCYRSLLDELPDAKWLIVERNVEDVAQTWSDILGYDSTKEIYGCKLELEGLKRRAGKMFTVNYDDLDSRLEEIERFLAPGFRCPQWRRDLLTGLNVKKTARMIRQEMENLWV